MNKKFTVTVFPKQKKKCLCIEEGNSITKLATFVSEKSKDEFLELMNEHLEILSIFSEVLTEQFLTYILCYNSEYYNKIKRWMKDAI